MVFYTINVAIADKVDALKIMGSRLCHRSKHDALLLLRHSFAIPKILYMLRTALCFSSSCRETYDQELRSILSEVLNISLLSDSAWSQATLPVTYGGIGVRSAVQLAPSAFLASAAGSSNLIHCILPGRLDGIPYPAVDDAKIEWSRGHDTLLIQLTCARRLGTSHVCKRLMTPFWKVHQIPDHVPGFWLSLQGSPVPG